MQQNSLIQMDNEVFNSTQWKKHKAITILYKIKMLGSYMWLTEEKYFFSFCLLLKKARALIVCEKRSKIICLVRLVACVDKSDGKSVTGLITLSKTMFSFETQKMQLSQKWDPKPVTALPQMSAGSGNYSGSYVYLL